MGFATTVGFFGNLNERRGNNGVAATALTFTVTSPATIYQSTAFAQFGNASMFQNSTSYISNTSSAGSVALNDFTVEGWIYIPTARTSAQNAIPFSSATSGALGIRFGNNGASDTNLNLIQVFRRGTADGEYATITWPRDQWNHWVAQRTGGGTANAQINFWVNGTKLTTLAGRTSNVANISFTASTSFAFGSAQGVEGLRGCYLDEFCLTVGNGAARYDTVGNIVVPTQPFQTDVANVVIMHFNAANGSTTFNNATT